MEISKVHRFIYHITSAGLISGIALSINLWLNDRFFPTVPLFDFLPQLRYPLDQLFLALLGLSIVACNLYYEIRILKALPVILLAVLCIFDINRLQPWIFLYTGILALFALVKKPGKLIPLLSIIVGASYLWSGIHKFNSRFFSEVVPWFSSAFGPAEEIFAGVFHLTPFLETAIGVLILLRLKGKVVVPMVIILHLLILFVTGPAGHNYNAVIWPWNLVMVLLVWLLVKTQLPQKVPMGINGVTVIYLLLPALHLFNLWPAYLSFNLYSGNTNDGTLYISEQVKELLPSEVKEKYLNEHNLYQVNIKSWGFKELAAPPFPEKIVYRRIQQSFINGPVKPGEVLLSYQPRELFFRSADPEVIVADEEK